MDKRFLKHEIFKTRRPRLFSHKDIGTIYLFYYCLIQHKRYRTIAISECYIAFSNNQDAVNFCEWITSCTIGEECLSLPRNNIRIPFQHGTN